MNLLNTWQFNYIGYLIGVVIFFQLYKLAVRNAKVDGAATLLLQFLAGGSILVLLPFFPLSFPQNWETYGFLILACIFYAINDRLQTTARKHLPVSMFSILNQLSTVFLIVLGLTLFREPFVTNKILGAISILTGNFILLYKKGKIQIDKNILISILATLSFAFAISIDIGISKQFNLPFYIMLTLVIPGIMIWLTEKIPIQTIIDEYNSKAKKYYVATGIAWGLTILFALRSFQFGEVTTIVPLQGLSVLINVIIAYFFLGEKRDKWKKILAAILVVLGVYLTVL